MSSVRDALQMAFRLVPWPTETGVRAIGNPDEWSPVLVTGNYDLSVRLVVAALEGLDAWLVVAALEGLDAWLVVAALEGLDAWLVVAPSSGINVWCAASGGHFGTSQVVTALKTSGIAERVRHRRAILPQLAATGVRARDVMRRCGWRTRFGPVRAEDLPAYLDADGKKTDAMRCVSFDARERLEMAVMSGVPAALLAAGLAALVHPPFALPLAGLALIAAIACYGVYDRLPQPRRALFTAGLAASALAITAFSGGGTAALLTAASAAVLLGAGLTFDYSGSTPIEGGSHFEERAWHVVLDKERCESLYTCWEVCPEACFEKPTGEDRRIELAREDRCVRCGACIVQCALDALAFQNDAGDRVPPATIRRYKLNLLGQRKIERTSPGAPA